MKKILIIATILTYNASFAGIDCSTIPVGTELAKAIETKDVVKAKTLLDGYKKDVSVYLKTCDSSKEKSEETSIMVHTYTAKLADVEFILKQPKKTTDCERVPSIVALSKAFKDNASDIEALYMTYTKDAEDYIKHCASHAEYEAVYESSMLYYDRYNELKSKK